MTPAQLQTLKAAIFASQDPAVIAARNAVNETELARLYNLPSSFIVWKTSVRRSEAMADGIDWTQVDNLSVGQGRIWDWLFDNNERSINPSDASQRAAISECWKGTAAKVAVATFVLTQCKRAASAAEHLFATGTGTTGTPGLLVWEGTVSPQTIADALGAT